MSAAPPSMGNMPSVPMTGMPTGFGAPTNAATGTAPPGMGAGAPTGAPMSPGAPGLPAGPVQAMTSQAPPTPPTAPTFPAAATGTPITVGDVPPPTQQMVAPTSTPSAPIVPSAPSATPISGSPPPPPTSGSAPVHPSARGAPGVGQPAAMVRQPAMSTLAQSPPGVGTQSVLATAGGATAGAMSADATAQTRLQRLVAVAASQQPRLAWAVGERPDDTTVLVTDLASGWIPPGIEIPAAVTFLEPARRRGDLETLLGEVKLATAIEPGRYRPESDVDEPVPTSPRPRRAPEVEELSWELSQATHWRDGLPRLAHTPARAAARGAGVLESEAEQLHNELTKLADRVLDRYPDDVDPADIGNWQLLAAIEALVNKDKAVANYHLAWFIACNTAAAEGVVR
ncbi:DUF5632 domain-containing protein [Candidatus Mycobacterium methanotrophicum]|uniref:DUF5632 domain-containing protein n=1 Tax=Candidatus Mycobacterium methanotrophicum TaxID=2943498 RepID=UPI001C596E6A|nr:DUF5631 domain-containing protein [Candidatus Mycobacterium methanotrophicum]